MPPGIRRASAVLGSLRSMFGDPDGEGLGKDPVCHPHGTEQRTISTCHRRMHGHTYVLLWPGEDWVLENDPYGANLCQVLPQLDVCMAIHMFRICLLCSGLSSMSRASPSAPSCSHTPTYAWPYIRSATDLRKAGPPSLIRSDPPFAKCYHSLMYVWPYIRSTATLQRPPSRTLSFMPCTMFPARLAHLSGHGKARGRSALEERFHERALVEHLQMVHTLTHPEVLDGDAELVADADGHAALGGPIDLGERQCGDVGS